MKACLFDVLDLVMKDEKAFFYPTHETFSYRRISQRKESADSPRFITEANVPCRLSGLVWNNSRLNLSIRTRVNGFVELPESAKDFDLPTKYPCFMYKNYTIVRDATMNVSKLPVSFQKHTWEYLNRVGIITEDWVDENHIYVIDLESMPILIEDDKEISAKTLAELALSDHRFSAYLKVLNYRLDSELAEPVAETSKEGFLYENNVMYDGSLRISSKFLESDERVTVPIFEVKVKGLSSLPAVALVKNKIKNGATLTLAESLIRDGLDLASTAESVPPEKVKDVLESRVTYVKEQQEMIRELLQRHKFKLFLGSKWLDGASEKQERTEVTIDNDVVCSIILGKGEIRS